LRLQAQWPNAVIVEDHRHTEMTASAICRLLRGVTPAEKMPLHVAGSNFQVAVWRALLAIAPGDSQTYSGIAQHIQTPNSTRAVANAIAANPVALLIPCHRVIRKSGALGGYRWGEQRKQVIRFYETAARHAAPDCA
ncbi:MAG: methylated-DNA--[protein]-cysteine S-methyltransferase, partial [Pseudohongiella sp.]|nr:methylated-DNA--[protein]-cysteine S-methyltransferase [Pseudohongiella sp.]